MAALMLARLWEKGSPPIAGGTLDQTAIMVDACDTIWAERQHWKAQTWEQQMAEMDE